MLGWVRCDEPGPAVPHLVHRRLGTRPNTRLDPARGFRRADDFADRHLCLPLWRHMTDTDVDRVITAVDVALEDIGA